VPPTPPGSGLLGPTRFAFLNLPVLRDADDKLGIYVAVSATIGSWSGCTVQASPDGGTTWTDLADITDQSIIGRLLTALPSAPSEVIDVTNTVRVQVSNELDSITMDQLLNELNACVIGEELCQFQTATLVTSDPLVYDLSVLTRGRLNSTPAGHHIGERFVLLNSPIFCELPRVNTEAPPATRPVSAAS